MLILYMEKLLNSDWLRVVLCSSSVTLVPKVFTGAKSVTPVENTDHNSGI